MREPPATICIGYCFAGERKFHSHQSRSARRPVKRGGLFRIHSVHQLTQPLTGIRELGVTVEAMTSTKKIDYRYQGVT
jgi:hypothetical protein